MSTQREGGCACGAVRYRLTSDPLFTHCCHCLNCQRQTGSAFVVNLLIETDRVELLSGDPQPVDAPRDDGSTQRVFRCPTCQVAVFSQYTTPGGALRARRDARRPRGSRTGRPHLHEVEGSLGHPARDDARFDVYYDTKALWPAASLERLAAAGV